MRTKSVAMRTGYIESVYQNYLNIERGKIMTKKETAIFNNLHDEALSKYMRLVMSHKDVPVDVLERACVYTELREALFSKDEIEDGA